MPAPALRRVGRPRWSGACRRPSCLCDGVSVWPWLRASTSSLAEALKLAADRAVVRAVVATDHVDRAALRGPIRTSRGVLVRGAAAASPTSATSSPTAPAAARTAAAAPWTAGVAIRTHASIPEAAAECSLGNARLAVTARQADIAASVTAGGPAAAGGRGRRAPAPIPQEHDDGDRHGGQRPPIAKHPFGSPCPTHHGRTVVDRNVWKHGPTDNARTDSTSCQLARGRRDACCPLSTSVAGVGGRPWDVEDGVAVQHSCGVVWRGSGEERVQARESP
jgi:hypothetical protein